jgi:hypothetical protein
MQTWKKFLLLCTGVLPLLLSGCASTIRSEVTAFHHWPTDAGGSSFAFTHQGAEAQDLERQNHENLVRLQLLKLGLRDATPGQPAKLAVRVDYSINARDVRVIETVLVDPWAGIPWYGPGYYRPYWGWPGYGYPYYGPGAMWPGMPVAQQQERRFTAFDRQLKVKIVDNRSQQTLYDVTVRSSGEKGNLVDVMPYLSEAAFRDFPGPNGTPRVIDIKMKR